MATGQAIFCVDAGGTRCRGRLYDNAGDVLAEAEGGPCNPSTDLAGSAVNLTSLWQLCAARANRDPADLTATFSIGGAGLFTRSVREAFLAKIPQFASKLTMSDGYAALIGAGGGAPCALIIAGTGVVAHRLFPDGRSLQRDGWGWIAGDRGSGAWLGQRALRHALATIDGLIPRDALAEAVLAQLREDDRQLGGWLVGLGPSRLGALAPLVLQAADAGEASARRIIQRATEHFADLAGTLDLADGVALFMAGGLAARFRAPLAARIGRDVLVPTQDALAGCRLVATGSAPPESAIDVLGFSAI
jgi:glucosamine kinase